MQMKERKKGELIVPLIKKNCVHTRARACVCVCVCLAWFSSSGNCMPSQTTAIKWALVNWRFKDERLAPGFQMGIGYTYTCTICLTLTGTYTQTATHTHILKHQLYCQQPRWLSHSSPVRALTAKFSDILHFRHDHRGEEQFYTKA